MEVFKKQDKSLGELLIQAGFISKEQLEEALAEQHESVEPLGKILVRKHFVKEENIIKVLKGMLVVVVEIHGELFGIEIVYSREIIKYRKITPLHNIPPYIKGVISIRDEVIPVISLSHKIFGADDPVTEETKIIIVDTKDATAGLIVDRIVSVRNFQTQSFANVTKYSFTVDKKFIAGLIKDGREVITLIKPEILFEGK